jgi:hypothetical protein
MRKICLFWISAKKDENGKCVPTTEGGLYSKCQIFVRLRKALLENWWVPASVPVQID